MTKIEGGHVDDRVSAVPGPDSVNRRVSGPGTEPGSVPGLVRLKWAICKRGYRVLTNVYHRLKTQTDNVNDGNEISLVSGIVGWQH